MILNDLEPLAEGLFDLGNIFILPNLRQCRPSNRHPHGSLLSVPPNLGPPLAFFRTWICNRRAFYLNKKKEIFLHFYSMLYARIIIIISRRFHLEDTLLRVQLCQKIFMSMRRVKRKS